MGWKMSAVFVMEEGAGLMVPGPIQEPQLEEIESIRLLKGYNKIRYALLDEVIYPDKSEIAVGVYENNAILCHWALPVALMGDRSMRKIVGRVKGAEDIKREFFELFSSAQVLSLVLHSAVNLWGYCLYDKGRLRRSAAGASDIGLVVNEGVLLPEERVILENATIDDYNSKGQGVELVFEMSRRVFGERIDEMRSLEHPMVIYQAKKRHFFERLCGNR
ncbi:DUF6928 family protein [Alloalcanivorax xenomutans]|uniref:Uncharacterized protein n=2 Tax=Oceanospirillales TaxID=135619 RepID=A0ABQ6Y3M6_9GAMM|nr:hypothetical protein A6D6_03684 [Alcanivorax xiamenensis]